MLKVTHLLKTYQNKDHVFTLNDICFETADKGLIAIVGKSGSGKSTLLNVIGTLDSYDCGDIIIDGMSLSTLSPLEIDYYRSSYIGFVFQEFNLLDELTVEENILLSRDLSGNINLPSIDEVLEKLEISHLRKRKVNELSGGEKQRVAIARAIIKKPKLLLCDEPTGMLDDENKINIFRILKKLSEDVLVLVVTHDKQAIEQYTDEIIELNDGNIINNTIKKGENQSFETIKNKKGKSLRNKDIIKLISRWIKIKFKRLLLMSILFLILDVIVLSFISIKVRKEKQLIAQSIYDSGIAYLTYNKEYYYNDEDNQGSMKENGLNDNGLKYLQNKFKTIDCVYNLLVGKYKSMAREIETNNKYDNTRNNGVIVLNDKFISRYNCKLYGSKPTTIEEVVITKYIFEMYQKFDYKEDGEVVNIKTYDDLIGKMIDIYDEGLRYQRQVKVVGILDTNLNSDRYKMLKKLSIESTQYRLINAEWETIRRYGIHNVCYVNEEFIKERSTNDYFSCVMTFKRATGSKYYMEVLLEMLMYYKKRYIMLIIIVWKMALLCLSL